MQNDYKGKILAIVAKFFVFFSGSLLVTFSFLFKSVYGNLLLLLIIYFNCEYFFGIKPFTVPELLNWLLNLSESYKVAFISSFITVIGFVVAFHTAATNWKNQMRIQVRYSLLNELSDFFYQFSGNMTTMHLFCVELVEVIELIEEGDKKSIEYSLKTCYRKMDEYTSARDSISKSSVKVHLLKSKNHSTISNIATLPSQVDIAIKQIISISNCMWFKIPIVDMNEKGYEQEFKNKLNLKAVRKFIKVTDRSLIITSGVIGGIQSTLAAPLFSFNNSAFLNLLLTRKEFTQGINSFSSITNKNK